MPPAYFFTLHFLLLTAPAPWVVYELLGLCVVLLSSDDQPLTSCRLPRHCTSWEPCAHNVQLPPSCSQNLLSKKRYQLIIRKRGKPTRSKNQLQWCRDRAGQCRTEDVRCQMLTGRSL